MYVDPNFIPTVLTSPQSFPSNDDLVFLAGIRLTTQSRSLLLLSVSGFFQNWGIQAYTHLAVIQISTNSNIEVAPSETMNVDARNPDISLEEQPVVTVSTGKSHHPKGDHDEMSE